jgi:hypothetical protein
MTVLASLTDERCLRDERMECRVTESNDEDGILIQDLAF